MVIYSSAHKELSNFGSEDWQEERGQEVQGKSSPKSKDGNLNVRKWLLVHS